MKSIYIINPVADFPTYFSTEVYDGWGLDKVASMADLSILTVAAMVPDDFEIELCDENITSVRLDARPDYVAITGKISQWGRMRDLARRFREKGTTVLIGGPYASLCPEVVREHCDILVRGEMEEIAEQLFSDLRQSNWKEEYVGTRPSLDLTPMPRYDLYDNDRTKLGTIQTSRGCPFECEFCDVIEYLGRKQRHKSVGNVLAELDEVYSYGYRTVFLSDDNFTIARHRAKELLAALKEWNERREAGRVTFLTQLSIDAAKDEEMLRMCAEAGLTMAFIGIETPNAESLKETKKPQNLGVDLAAQVGRFHEYGILVYGGMIVGFDSDGPDIFQRQYDFATKANLPILSLGALVAPAATGLHRRLEKENRLTTEGSEMAATPWSTNIVPKGLSRDQLLHGIKWLANRLYDPEEFGDRAIAFAEHLGERRDLKSKTEKVGAFGIRRSADKDGRKLVRMLSQLGPKEDQLVRRVLDAASNKPAAFELLMTLLHAYSQVRYMYNVGEFWEPAPVAPHAATA